MNVTTIRECIQSMDMEETSRYGTEDIRAENLNIHVAPFRNARAFSDPDAEQTRWKDYRPVLSRSRKKFLHARRLSPAGKVCPGAATELRLHRLF